VNEIDLGTFSTRSHLLKAFLVKKRQFGTLVMLVKFLPEISGVFTDPKHPLVTALTVRLM